MKERSLGNLIATMDDDKAKEAVWKKTQPSITIQMWRELESYSLVSVPNVPEDPKAPGGERQVS